MTRKIVLHDIIVQNTYIEFEFVMLQNYRFFNLHAPNNSPLLTIKICIYICGIASFSLYDIIAIDHFVIEYSEENNEIIFSLKFSDRSIGIALCDTAESCKMLINIPSKDYFPIINVDEKTFWPSVLTADIVLNLDRHKLINTIFFIQKKLKRLNKYLYNYRKRFMFTE